MSIKYIQPGQVGVSNNTPSWVYIETDDTYATVSATGYLSSAAHTYLELFQNNMMALISTKTSQSIHVEPVLYLLQLQSTNGVWSLVPMPSASGVTPLEVQQDAFNTGIDTGIADAYVVALSPTVTALTDGLRVAFQALNSNVTNSPTLDVGTGPIPISTIGLNALLAGDINSFGTNSLVEYSAAVSSFILLNPFVSIPNLAFQMTNSYTAGVDGGTANTYSIGLLVPSAALFIQGATYQMQSTLNNNTGASTFAITGNGAGTIPIVLPDGSALSGGEILAGQAYYFLISDAGAQAVLMNSSLAPSSGITNVNQAASTATLAANSRYAVNNGATLVTFTLPASPAIGDTSYIIGQSAGGWKVAQNASQQCHLGTSPTTSGTGGSLASSNQYDCITITCSGTNIFTIYGAQGNITIV